MPAAPPTVPPEPAPMTKRVCQRRLRSTVGVARWYLHSSTKRDRMIAIRSASHAIRRGGSAFMLSRPAALSHRFALLIRLCGTQNVADRLPLMRDSQKVGNKGQTVYL